MQKSQDIIQQVRFEANRLIEEASDGFTVFKWLDDAGDEGRALYGQVVQLHNIAKDVGDALRRREEQLSEEGNPRAKGEIVLWMNAKAHLEQCHHILNELRRLLVGWDAEHEPSRTHTVKLQLKMSLWQKGKVAKLQRQLNMQFQSLQLNVQAINAFIQVDTQERIGQTNQRIDDMSTRMLSELSKLYEKFELLTKTVERGPSPKLVVRSPSDAEYAAAAPHFTPSSSVYDESLAPEDTSHSDAEDMKDQDVYKEALRNTREMLKNYVKPGTFSSVAIESTSGSHSDISDLEENEQSWRRPSTQYRNPSTTIADVTDYAGAVAHFKKKPLEDYNELVDEHYTRAQTSLKEKQYSLAEGYLKKAIELARERKQFHNVPFEEIEMQDMLGMIFLKWKRYQRALGVWVELLPRKNDQDDTVTAENCNHYQFVAETYFQMWKSKKEKGEPAPEDLIAALDYAESAYHKRVELIGEDVARDSREVRSAAGLLFRIHESLGNSAEAAVYRRRATGVKISKLEDGLEMETVEDDAVLLPGERPTTALVNAILNRKESRALALLKKEDIKFELERRLTKEKLTPLMMAFKISSESVVQALLERNADITATEPIYERTVLHQTALAGNADMVGLAIRHCKKGMIEQKDKDGFTPLLLAVAANNEGAIEVVRILLSEEADMNAKDANEDTVIHLAALNSSVAASAKSPNSPERATELLSYLLEQKNCPKVAKNNLGNTPLILACENGNSRTAEILLKNRVDVNAKNKANQTALYITVDERPLTPQWENTVRVLLTYNAEIPANEKELPRKWKDFRHLVHKPPVRGELRRTRTNSNQTLSPGQRPRRDSRRGSSSLFIRDVERTNSSSTIETSASKVSKGSSRLSRMLSWKSHRDA